MGTTSTATSMKPRHSSNGGAEDIRAGIDQTRAQMDGTLDELTERLKPRHLLDDVLDYFQSRRERGAGDGARVKQAAGHARDSAADAGKVVIRQVKRHPIPALLMGAGLAWLLLESDDEKEGYAELYSEDAAEQYYADQGGEYTGTPILEGEESGPAAVGPESYALPSHYSADGDSEPGRMSHLKEKSAQMRARAAAKMHRARRRSSERAAQWRERAGEKGAEWKGQASDAYSQGAEKFKETAHDYPLAVGAGFLALGVLAGMLLPSTRKENELVGPARDRLVRRTREAADEAIYRGKHVAESVVEAARAEAQEQGLTTEALKEKGAHVVDSVKSAAREEGLTPEALKRKARAVAAEAKDTAREESSQQAHELKENV